MQNTSAMKEATNESESGNGPGQSSERWTIHPRCDESAEFVTRDYHRVFSDDRGVLHACLESLTRGTERGESR
ncbi:DUF7563 family protein [Halalkalicoccus salilacus]